MKEGYHGRFTELRFVSIQQLQFFAIHRDIFVSRLHPAIFRSGKLEQPLPFPFLRHVEASIDLSQRYADSRFDQRGRTEITGQSGEEVRDKGLKC
jgi:hypothetical protein